MNWWNLCIISSQLHSVLQSILGDACWVNPILYLVMGHLEMRLDKACCPLPTENKGTTPTCYTPAVHVHFGQPQNSKLWATTLIQNTAINSCLSLLLCSYCSLAKPRLTSCHPKDCSMPGSPVLPYWFKFVSIESVMLSNHLILCHPLLLLPLTFDLPQHQCLFQWVGFS